MSPAAGATGAAPGPDEERRVRRNRARAARIRRGQGGAPTAPAGAAAGGVGDLARALLEQALRVETAPTRVALAGRVALWLLLVRYGLWYASLEVNRSQDMQSVVDFILGRANLVFHEAGHVILSVLGEFMGVLGGSLFQVTFPLVFLAAFLTAHPDPFGASVMLWWSGQNLVDVAPYVADARAQRLILLGGVTGRDVPGYHDWNNLLGRLGMLSWDQALGRTAHALGALLILVALAWGGYLLLQQLALVREEAR